MSEAPASAPAAMTPSPSSGGAFDDPNFDMRHHPTAQAGITCRSSTITSIDSPVNGSYTMDKPSTTRSPPPPTAPSSGSTTSW